MERTILATVDGSTLSHTVLHYLPAIVRPNDEIVLLTVLHFPQARRRTSVGYEAPIVVGSLVSRLEPTTPDYAEDEQQAIESTRSEALEYLDEQALFLRNEGLFVTTAVVFDDNAGHGIVEYARNLGPLFIAMATHGRDGLDHALHGSVAEHVVRSRVAPVLVVRP